jgi:hypothetical protein
MNSVLSRYQTRHGVPTPAGELAPGSLTYSTDIQPFHGVVDGQLVKISREGNIVGSSPCFFATDRNGIAAWVPQADVVIAEPIMLPIDPERLQGPTNMGTTARGSDRERN